MFLWWNLCCGMISFFQEGWWWVEKGGDTFDFSGQPAGDSLGTMLMKFTFCKSHFEIVYNQKEPALWDAHAWGITQWLRWAKFGFKNLQGCENIILKKCFFFENWRKFLRQNLITLVLDLAQKRDWCQNLRNFQRRNIPFLPNSCLIIVRGIKQQKHVGAEARALFKII